MDYRSLFVPWMRQVVRAVYERAPAELQPFAEATERFVNQLLADRLPSDWREQVEAHLDQWRERGFEVPPVGRRRLEDWIEGWARLRKLLPASQSIVATTAAPARPSSAGVLPTTGPAPTSSSPVDERAGPGPETSESFRRKVETALDILDPRIGLWWRANSVSGLVRSRDATSWVFAYRWNHYTTMENGRPIIWVDSHYTAGETALAIIDAVQHGGMLGDSITNYYRSYHQARRLNALEFADWRQKSLGEAAHYASTFAEIYYSSLA